MPSDPSRLIAALARDRINLDLKTLDLCFLAGLYLRADRASLASHRHVRADMRRGGSGCGAPTQARALRANSRAA
jgi:hypothetical protein